MPTHPPVARGHATATSDRGRRWKDARLATDERPYGAGPLGATGAQIGAVVVNMLVVAAVTWFDWSPADLA